MELVFMLCVVFFFITMLGLSLGGMIYYFTKLDRQTSSLEKKTES